MRIFLSIIPVSALLFILAGSHTSVASIFLAEERQTLVSINSQDPVQPSNIYLPITLNRADPTLGIPVFGVQMYGGTGSSSQFFSALVDSKASWLRVNMNWSGIEPTNRSPEQYRWGHGDNAVAAARDTNINLIVTLQYTPDWAAPNVDGAIYEENIDDFVEYIGAVVERYDGDGVDDAPGSPAVNHWEFFNEPDREERWGNIGNRYADMLRAIHPVVKAANPNAQIVFGGISYDWFTEDGGPFIQSFVDDVLENGGGDYFDIMNFHAYPFYYQNWAPQISGIPEKTQVIREVLARHGVEKPLVVTETGRHSDAPVGQPASSPEEQARYVVVIFTESMAANIQAATWFTLYPPSYHAPYPLDNGLVTLTGQHKPAFLAYQTIVAQLSTAHFERTLPIAETGSEDIEAYQLVDNINSKRIYVAWRHPIMSSEKIPLNIPASTATIRTIYDETSAVNDGDDGSVDGVITVMIDGEPKYIEVSK